MRKKFKDCRILEIVAVQSQLWLTRLGIQSSSQVTGMESTRLSWLGMLETIGNEAFRSLPPCQPTGSAHIKNCAKARLGYLAAGLVICRHYPRNALCTMRLHKPQL